MIFFKHVSFLLILLVPFLKGFTQVEERLPCLDKKFSVVVHIVKDSLGDPVIQESEILTAVDTLNRYFSPICVSFEICEFKYIDNWRYNEFDADSHWVEMQVLYHEENRINLFYVDNIIQPNGECGYTDIGYITNTDSSGVVIKKDGTSCFFDNLKALVHEMGHYFGLANSYEGSGVELVDGSNCSTDGDLICDTPGDPYGGGASTNYVDGNCRFINMSQDANGDYYSPHVGNAMSFYPGACMCEFSYEQLLFMANKYKTGTGMW